MVDCELVLECKLVTCVNGGTGKGVRNEDRTERMIAVVAKNVRFPDSSTRQIMPDAQIPILEETIQEELHEHHSTIEEKNAKLR